MWNTVEAGHTESNATLLTVWPGLTHIDSVEWGLLIQHREKIVNNAETKSLRRHTLQHNGNDAWIVQRKVLDSSELLGHAREILRDKVGTAVNKVWIPRHTMHNFSKIRKMSIQIEDDNKSKGKKGESLQLLGNQEDWRIYR